jgi:hypothetical protein
MNGKDSFRKPSYDHDTSTLFYLLFFVLFATFGTAVLFYQETFLFWELPFSELGNTVTLLGNRNDVSRLIFSIGMLVESGIMLQIWAHYSEESKFRNRGIKHGLAFLGSIGFLISIFPNDRFHVIHSTGVGIVVGILNFFAIIYLFELKDRLPSRQFFSDAILLQMAVFPYAVSFFADWASKQSYQKICMMGIFYVLLKTVSATKEGFKPYEVLGIFKRFQH